MKDVLGGGATVSLSSAAVVIAALLLGCKESPSHSEPSTQRADASASPSEKAAARARLGPDAVDAKLAAHAVQGTLHIVDDRGTRNFILSETLPRFAPRIVDTFDPYYKSNKRFLAVPLGELLSEAWPNFRDEAGAEIEFSAVDGYKVRIRAELARHSSAFVAFKDIEHPPFAPISDRKADPSPLYLFWAGRELTDLETHPRPWGIVTIRKVQSGQGQEHVTPPHGFGENACAATGFQLFSAQCQRCHAINGEGGHLGPDLNVPRNILEYRSVADVRAYIKDPATFRYGNMPAHPLLTEKNLDQLVCYLREMGKHKFDPRRQPAKTEKGS